MVDQNTTHTESKLRSSTIEARPRAVNDFSTSLVQLIIKIHYQIKIIIKSSRVNLCGGSDNGRNAAHTHNVVSKCNTWEHQNADSSNGGDQRQQLTLNSVYLAFWTINTKYAPFALVRCWVRPSGSKMILFSFLFVSKSASQKTRVGTDNPKNPFKTKLTLSKTRGMWIGFMLLSLLVIAIPYQTIYIGILVSRLFQYSM